jgi:SAM-dependent methyltransferase
VGGIYDRYARSPRRRRAWAADNPGNVAIRGELLSYILRLARAQIESSGPILDLGSGTGWLLRALANAGVSAQRLTGLDVQPSRVAAARQAVPGARVMVADVRRLALPDGEFSLVLMLTLLSSLGSAGAVRQALAEARRVLAPGGLLLCYEPRVPNPLNRRTRLIGDGDLAAAGIVPHEDTTLTLVPALARRLGRRTPERYARLARLRALRTHRLIAYGEYARADDADE